MSKQEIKCFKYKGNIYFGKQPAFTRISKVLYDDKLGIEVGYLVAARPMILPLVSVFFVFFSLYTLITQETESHYVNVPKVISFYDNYLDINIINSEQNEQNVDINLLYKDISLFTKEDIKPGEFIGTIEKVINLAPGSYTCKFKYVVHGKHINTVRYYDVLLTVK